MNVDGCTYCDDAYEDGYLEGEHCMLLNAELQCCGICSLWKPEQNNCFYYPRVARFEACKHWENGTDRPKGFDIIKDAKLLPWPVLGG